LQLYQQTNARLWRQGQKDTVVITHILTCDAIDERILAALKKKDKTQSALIEAVKADMTREVKPCQSERTKSSEVRNERIHQPV